MATKEQFAHIRNLIKQKEYTEARRLLNQLSAQGSSTADKWLANLDKIAPPPRATQSTYNTNRLDEIKAQKEAEREAQQRRQTQQRTIGCLLRGCLPIVILTVVCSLAMPLMLAAGITSESEPAQQTSRQVLTFVSEQQQNPVGRTITNVYASTSGRTVQAVVEPQADEICSIAIDRAAQNGRTVTQDECQRTLNEAMTCVTTDFARSEACLRDYMYNRCIRVQPVNNAQSQAYCRSFVNQHMGEAITSLE